MQSIANNKSSNNYEYISKNNNDTVNDSVGDFSKLINNESRQQLTLEPGHSALLQRTCGSKVANKTLNNDSVEKKSNLTESLNAVVAKAEAENKKNILSVSDIDKIKTIVDDNKWGVYGCDGHIRTFMNLLPFDIQKKLTVILSTHEIRGVPYYGGTSYAFHTFVFGKTENSSVIVDLSNKNYRPYKVVMEGGEFFSKAFKPIVKSLLYHVKPERDGCTPVLIQSNLPEFRLIPAQDYLETSAIDDIRHLIHPYHTEKYNPSFLNNKFWISTYRLNIFEFFSLLNDPELWGDLVKQYDTPPIARLGFENKPIQHKLIKKLNDIAS